MKQLHSDDKLFISEFSLDIHEGYLRHMKRYGAFPIDGRMLGIAFGHNGKIRLLNALGYMKPLAEADKVEALPNVVSGPYSLVAVYYVGAALAADELSLFIQTIKNLLAPGGRIMAVESPAAMYGFRGECRKQGFNVLYTEPWRREPINTWDNRGNRGLPLSPLARRIPLLRRFCTHTVSSLLEMR